MGNHQHFLLHKPIGYVTQFVYNQTKRRNKKLLGELFDFPEGTMSIGRLDKNSEGLLLLTTDGQISERVRRKDVEKEYYVEVDGEVTVDKINQLESGIEISIFGKPYHTLPCKVLLLEVSQLQHLPINRNLFKRHRPTTWLSIVLTEGKFRQVRKMTAKVGLPTLRLVRGRVGAVELGGMTSGQVVPTNLEDYFDLNK